MSHSSGGVIGGTRPYNPMSTSPGKLFVSLNSNYTNSWYYQTVWTSTGYAKVKYSWNSIPEVRGNGTTIQYNLDGSVDYTSGPIDLSTGIPNSGSRSVLIESCDENGMASGVITGLEISVEGIVISSNSIANLTSLEYLNLYGTSLYTSSFIDAIPSLTTLQIYECSGFITLDLTNKTNIDYAYIYNIDTLKNLIAPNVSMKYLAVYECYNLENINLENSTNESTIIYRGKFSEDTLNITGFSAKYFSLGMSNNLINLDLSVTGNLAYDADFQYNGLEIADFYYLETITGVKPEVKGLMVSYLPNIDPNQLITNFPNLEKFSAFGQEFLNDKDSNDFGNPLVLTGYTNLKSIDVSHTNYGKIDISTNYLLEKIRSYNNWNLGENNQFVPGASGNNNLNNYPNLKSINMSSANNFIDVWDSSDNNNLEYVYIENSSQPSTSFDFSNCTRLGQTAGWFRIQSNFSSLDVAGCTGMTKFESYYGSNEIYDLTTLDACQEVYIIDYAFPESITETQILVNGMPGLRDLYIGAPKFVDLDIFNCPELKVLYLSAWGVPSNVPESQIDAALIQLDLNGKTNGYVYVSPGSDTTGRRTTASDAAVASLISKGWSINLQQPLH